MEMSDFTGDDLLELFDDLDIELGNLNANVIKGWFDTDCKDTKDCLRWMCASITNANLLSAQEKVESSEIPFIEDKYDSNLTTTQEKYPGIFDNHTEIEFELEMLEDEKQLYSEELDHVDYLLSINEKIHEKACSDLHKVTNDEILAKSKLEQEKEKCESLCSKLDEIDIQLLEQINRYTGYLSDFEFAALPQFIHNMPVYTCEDNYLMMSGYLNTFLKREYGECTLNATDNNKSCYSEGSSRNLLNDRIYIIRNRIYIAWQKYLMEKFKAEELKAVIYLLNTYNVNYSSLLLDRAQIEMSVESKTEQKSVMLGMIENISMKHADHQVSQPNLRFAQKELEIEQLKLKNLKQLVRDISKLLATYSIMSTLFLQEHVDIVDTDEFFKKVVNYVTKDLQMCILRTEAMSNLIDEFELYRDTPVIQKLKIIHEIMKYVTDKKVDNNIENVTLMKAVSLKNELKDQVFCAEQQICFKDFHLQRQHSKRLKEEINTLNQFLMCGPTTRVVAIPSELFNVFREINMFMDNQSTAVKSLVDIIGVTSKTLAQKKWFKHRRYLWKHFLNDLPKLFAVMKSIEDEYNSLKIST